MTRHAASVAVVSVASTPDGREGPEVPAGAYRHPDGCEGPEVPAGAYRLCNLYAPHVRGTPLSAPQSGTWVSAGYPIAVFVWGSGSCIGY